MPAFWNPTGHQVSHTASSRSASGSPAAAAAAQPREPVPGPPAAKTPPSGWALPPLLGVSILLAALQTVVTQIIRLRASARITGSHDNLRVLEIEDRPPWCAGSGGRPTGNPWLYAGCGA